MIEPIAPNTGRILDYWLGGSHHFESDVAAAQAYEALIPDCAGVFRTLRDYLGRTCRFMAEQGIEQFLVFGAGIPTCDNVHQVVPEARVLYTDIDPANIELGQQLLATTPLAKYTYCDAGDFTTLDPAIAQSWLNLEKPLGVVFIGVAVFIADERLKAMLAQLYDWVAPGSYLAIDFDSQAIMDYPEVLALLQTGGDPFYMRSPEMIYPLLGPWQLTPEDIQPVAVWQNPDGDRTQPTFMYGCVAYRP